MRGHRHLYIDIVSNVDVKDDGRDERSPLEMKGFKISMSLQAPVVCAGLRAEERLPMRGLPADATHEEDRFHCDSVRDARSDQNLDESIRPESPSEEHVCHPRSKSSNGAKMLLVTSRSGGGCW